MNLRSTKLDRGQNAHSVVTRRHDIPGATIAWTDGSCHPNPGPGGWGVYLQGSIGTILKFGGELDTTNSRMELMAMIAAVERCPPCSTVIVRTDSQFCVKSGVSLWGRKTNRDLWARLDAACVGKTVLYEWWKGHAGTEGNEIAHGLALRGRLAAERELATCPRLDRVSASWVPASSSPRSAYTVAAHNFSGDAKPVLRA